MLNAEILVVHPSPPITGSPRTRQPWYECYHNGDGVVRRVSAPARGSSWLPDLENRRGPPTGEECEAPMRWSLGANLVVLGSVAATAIAIALFLWLLMPPPVEVQAQTTAPRQSAQYRRRHLCLFLGGAARPSSRGPLTRTTTSPSGNWRWTSTLVFSTGKRNRRRHLPPMAASPRASLTPSRMTAPTL